MRVLAQEDPPDTEEQLCEWPPLALPPPAAPTSRALSRPQPGFKAVVGPSVTLGHWHIQTPGQQRICEVIQTQQPHLTDGETEAGREKHMPEDTW